MKKSKLLILFFLISILKIQATEYYVSNTTGNDNNNGTLSQPWKTISKAAGTLIAGDTVYIMAGTYLPTQQIAPINSGTSTNFINYVAYPGDEHLVIIDGTNIPLTNWYGIISILTKEYIKISGLKVINSSFAGIFINNSANIIIENNHTYQTHSSGISAWSSNNILVDNNQVVRACWPSDGLQECISIVGSNQVIVKNNKVFDGGSIGFGGGGEGIDIKDGCTNTVVFNNTVHDVASVGIYIDAYLTNQSNVHVFNNTIYNIFGVGISVASEEGGNLENVLVNNNTISNCQDRSLVIHWTNKPNYIIRNIYIYHNTFYNNFEGLDIGAHALSQNLNIVNNIFSQNLVYQIQNSSNDFDLNQLTVKNNLFDGLNPAWAISGINYITGIPNFVDAPLNNFHLQSTSIAINQGTYLTKTSSSGTGNTIPVLNAGFFSNGYGVISGDIIQFEGQTQEFEVIAVDSINNMITLNQPATWNVNQGISLKYNESLPDIGAFEYDNALNILPNNLKDLKIYPNPTNSVLHIPNAFLGSSYQIISMSGVIIKEGKTVSSKINVSTIQNGVYYLRFVDENFQLNSVFSFYKI